MLVQILSTGWGGFAGDQRIQKKKPETQGNNDVMGMVTKVN